MEKEYSICHSCGKKVEFAEGEPPCKALVGWLVVSHWKGFESVENYYFCSFTCLERWVDTKVPKIPEIFLKSFEEGGHK